MKKTVFTLALAAAALGCAAQTNIPRMKPQIAYPKAPTSDVVDRYFGLPIADPYRPLEDDNAPATKEWVEAENAVTRAYLDASPYLKPITRRLEKIYDYKEVRLPSRQNDGRYYIYGNDGKQNQPILYVMDSPKGAKKVFIDPNALSKDGTVALKSVQLSEDGSLTAYNISRNGSDWEEIHVMDTKTGKKLPDVIENVKFAPASWAGNGFYYAAYDKPKPGEELSASNNGSKIYYHRLGTRQADDKLVYQNTEQPMLILYTEVPEGSNTLFVSGTGAGVGNSLVMHKLAADGTLDPGSSWETMVSSFDFDNKIIGAFDRRIYIMTSWGAPNQRIMVADALKPTMDVWREIVPETDAVLKDAQFAGDRLVLNYERDALSEIYLADLSGKVFGQIELPNAGTAVMSCSRKSPELFVKSESFIDPGTIYQYDLKKNKRELFAKAEIAGFDPDDYVIEQVFFPSKDGTQVPMFIVHRADIEPGKIAHPTLLYGYGGFNYSVTPTFAPHLLLWLENGGVYASVNLRGGNEYGEKWHLAGTKLNKQNVFDDCIAAAEYLIDNNWTSKENLAVMGGSNGGLLVGAVINQRPDLFAAAIPRMGVLDMMRYHLFTVGWNWAPDYGRSDDSPEMAKYLLGYSPLHNIRSGVNYPAVLILTADHDDRVVPAHSFKYAATLQDANTGPEPKLIRIDSNAGHGAGMPTSKKVSQYADIYSFIFNALELDKTK